MKPLNFIISISIIYVIVSCDSNALLNNNTSWNVDKFFNEKNIKIHGIISLGSSNCLVFGYDQEIFNCGYQGIVNCSPLKIWKTDNGGESWTEIVDDEISFKHSFSISDKVNLDGKLNSYLLSQLGKKVSTYTLIGKGIYDYINYTDFRSKGRYFYDQGIVYAYIDYFLYQSFDEGQTWSSVEIEGQKIIGDDIDMDIVDNHLLLYDAYAKRKYCFKKKNSKRFSLIKKKFVIEQSASGEKHLINQVSDSRLRQLYHDTVKSVISYKKTTDMKAEIFKIFKIESGKYALFHYNDNGYSYNNIFKYNSEKKEFQKGHLKYFDSFFPPRYPDKYNILGITDDGFIILELYYKSFQVDALVTNARYGEMSYGILRNDSLMYFPYYGGISDRYGLYYLLVEASENNVYFYIPPSLYSAKNLLPNQGEPHYNRIRN